MPEQLVYFMQGANGGPVKIGVARDPERRRVNLQTGHPHALRLLRTDRGGVELEEYLHERFAAHRTFGEWFEPTADLLAVIANDGPLDVFFADVLDERRVGPRTEVIQIRVTPEEKAAIQAPAAERGMDVASYIRKAAIYARLRSSVG